MMVFKRHDGSCRKCQQGASSFNHCSFCGLDFETQKDLLNHLDGTCGDEQEKSFRDHLADNPSSNY